MYLNLGQEILIRKIDKQLEKELLFFLQHARRLASDERALNKILAPRNSQSVCRFFPIHGSQLNWRSIKLSQILRLSSNRVRSGYEINIKMIYNSFEELKEPNFQIFCKMSRNVFSLSYYCLLRLSIIIYDI